MPDIDAKNTPDVDTIDIIEVFSSIQGEGALVGYRQVFVRLAGCNLECSYCDTPGSQTENISAHLECVPGSQEFIETPTRLSIDYLARHINKLLLSPHHSVSLTGGEPLLQAKALKKLAPQIKAPLYLETNGTLTGLLDIILEHIDYISMDIKLPSSITPASGNQAKNNYWQNHADFLKKTLENNKKVFIKIVITEETNFAEMETAINLISSLDSKIPLIIQPATLSASLNPVSFDIIRPFFEQALKKLADVRVIPQTHKIMKII